MDRLCGVNAAARKERAAHPIEALQCSRWSASAHRVTAPPHHEPHHCEASAPPPRAHISAAVASAAPLPSTRRGKARLPGKMAPRASVGLRQAAAQNIGNTEVHSRGAPRGFRSWLQQRQIRAPRCTPSWMAKPQTATRLQCAQEGRRRSGPAAVAIAQTARARRANARHPLSAAQER